MNIKTFIDRPVLSSVISIVLVFIGLIALNNLPIERYPSIAPPTVSVSTTYSGASSSTTEKSVTIPIEEAVNGTEDMTYMKSTSSDGGLVNVTVFFKQDADPNMAAVNVQNAVARASRSLPAEVNEVGITVRKRLNTLLYQASVYSPNGSYSREFLSNYMKINLIPQISRIPGVGDVDVRGADYSMRIWLRPDMMAQYQLVPSDITAVLNEQNLEASTGSIGENSDQTFEYKLSYRGRLEKPEEFENMVLRALPNGEVLRLKDVATVELGSRSYSFKGTTNHAPSSSITVYQSPGSNATEVVEAVDKFMQDAAKDFPVDMELAVLNNANKFLYASIENVVRTLIEAIILVMLVVLLFLGSGRSTLIPIVATLVSIIGTFAFLLLFGFTINLLTLFALVLSIGVVVDDSIIVVEAVTTKLESGYKNPKQASVDAMHDVTSALVTSTLVFMCVFIPVSFMGGTSGIFYRQFGITMAISVGISAINALTLSPALCALLLRPADPSKKKNVFKRFFAYFDMGVAAVRKKYAGGIRFFLRHRFVSPAIALLSIVALAYYMHTAKTGLVPDEDMGVVRVDVVAPEGSSLATTSEILDRLEPGILAAVEDEMENYEKLAGFGNTIGAGSSKGSFTIRLKDWKYRPGKEHTSDAIVDRLKDFVSTVTDAKISVIAPAPLPGYGGVSGLSMSIQDRKGGTIEELAKVTDDFIAAMRLRPETSSIMTAFKATYPQYIIDVDAVKCKRAGISPKDVLNVFQGYYGGILSTKFNRFTKIYQVTVQADPAARADKESVNNMYVRTPGGMAPVSQFVTLQKRYGPESLSRFNMFPAIDINGRPAEGYSTGDLIKAAEQVAAEVLPTGYGYEYSGLTREEAESSGNTLLVFAVCFALIYLILCALYESYLLPLAILICVPMGLLGSFVFARWFGVENNIYLQTGLVMLIGLLSKTAILITEYAVEKRRAGMGLAEAALGACKERFRPIMMTVLTMVFGLLPLLFATGAGCNGNRTLGAGVIGGMIFGTLGMLFIVPVMFIVFQGFQERLQGKKRGWKPEKPAKDAALKSIALIIAAGIGLSSTTSCSIYKEYERQPIAALDSLYGPGMTDTTSIESLSWRSIFTDPVLVGYIEKALANNKDLEVASQRIAEANAALKTAKGDFLPTLSVSPSIGATWSNERYGGMATSYGVPLVASWELDFAGGKFNKVRKSRATLSQAMVYKRLVQTDVICSVADTYYTLMKLDAALSISRSTAKNWRDNVRVMEALMEAGMTNKASISQTEANSASVEASLYEYEYQIRKAENVLAVLLGVPSQHFKRSKITDYDLPSDMTYGVPAALLQNRPDVMYAELEVRKAYYDVNISKAAFYPTIRLSGEIGWEKALTSPVGWLYSVGASLVSPIYSGGKNRRALEAAKARQKAAVASFEKTLLQAGTEVNNAMALCHAAAGKADVRVRQIEALLDAVNSTSALMRHSESTYLEVLTAQQSLLSARLLQISDAFDAAEGTIALFRALGGGVEEQEETTKEK